MDIKLNAKLSAYSRLTNVNEECDHEAVSFDDIDSLFETTNNNIPEQNNRESNEVSFSDIDSLFR